MEDIDRKTLISEARIYIQAAGHATEDHRYDALQEWAREILRPLAEDGDAEAAFLLGLAEFQYGFGDKTSALSEEEFRDRELRWLRKAAAAGIEDARFRLACTLDEEATVEESARLFRELAESGHAYAQWVHGLNLIGGTGQPADENEGIAFIVRAAEGRFEGAIKWMADAFASGTHGFPKDEAQSAAWSKRLYRADTIRY